MAPRMAVEVVEEKEEVLPQPGGSIGPHVAAQEEEKEELEEPSGGSIGPQDGGREVEKEEVLPQPGGSVGPHVAAQEKRDAQNALSPERPYVQDYIWTNIR